MGDLKLAVSLGLVPGLANLFVGFLVGDRGVRRRRHPAAGYTAVSLRTAIPFGPALIAAGVIGDPPT